MKCVKPFFFGSVPCPCTQCAPCRLNRRRVWTHRIILESYLHPGSCFGTLTYDPSKIPTNGSLDPTHTTNWLKRLRKVISPAKIRYFLVGEYGDKTQRPHYHVALFGLDPVSAGGLDGRSGLVAQTWGLGHTFVGTLNEKSASYVAGYVTKKMTTKEDSRLNGRYPEFARMSLRPCGIGGGSIPTLERSLGSNTGLDSIVLTGDVPLSLRHGSTLLPLGRYLRGKLRSSLGLDAEKIKQSNLRRACDEVQRLYAEDEVFAKNAQKSTVRFQAEQRKQVLTNLNNRLTIRSQGRTL